MVIVNQEKCVGCSQCVPFCPEEALTVWGLVSILIEKCTDCLICCDYCPVGALEAS